MFVHNSFPPYFTDYFKRSSDTVFLLVQQDRQQIPIPYTYLGIKLIECKEASNFKVLKFETQFHK